MFRHMKGFAIATVAVFLTAGAVWADCAEWISGNGPDVEAVGELDYQLCVDLGIPLGVITLAICEHCACFYTVNDEDYGELNVRLTETECLGNEV